MMMICEKNTTKSYIFPDLKEFKCGSVYVCVAFFGTIAVYRKNLTSQHNNFKNDIEIIDISACPNNLEHQSQQFVGKGSA